jgi:predicted AlkP superfamily phosphohydrolase/phosphomutase
LNTPVLVLGLDMGDGGLIHHWIRQGRLPHFGRLVDKGISIDLESPAAVLHTSAWPTFATGVLPGRHGVYYPYQPKPGHQFARQIDVDQCAAPTFWSRAAGARRRCVVYDIPETFPERGFSGRAVFDWGTWARYGRTSGQPAHLLEEMKSRFGKYPLGFEAMRLGFGDPQGIDERMLQAIRYKAATAQWLLQQDEWDLAVIGFGETHPAGHYLWPPGITGVVDTVDEASFERLFAVYAAIDGALGALWTNLPSDGVLIVASGDGVRANNCGGHLLPGMLDRLGFSSSRQTSSVEASGRRRLLVPNLPGLVPTSVKRQIAARLPLRVRNQLSLWTQASAFDWSRTRAFALPTDLEGCVRINLKGREPFGIVAPGAQYDDLCQEIRARLEEVVNPATGAPAVRRVWIRNETFPGPQQDELPDLIVTWNGETPIAAVTSPSLGVVEGMNPDPRPGTHSTSGFLMAQGPDIESGNQSRGRLVDIAATVLHLLGLTRMDDLEGTPLRLSRTSDLVSN